MQDNAFSSVGGFDWASNKIEVNKTSNIGSFENSLKTFGQRNYLEIAEIYYKTYGGLPYKWKRSETVMAYLNKIALQERTGGTVGIKWDI